MKHPTDDEIEAALVRIISDGFNRSIGALESAGAINTQKMRAQYTGVGCRFYNMVTKQIALTAKYAAPSLRQLFSKNGETVGET